MRCVVLAFCRYSLDIIISYCIRLWWVNFTFIMLMLFIKMMFTQLFQKLFNWLLKKKEKVLFRVLKFLLVVLLQPYLVSNDILVLFLSSCDTIDLNLIVGIVYNTNTDVLTLYFSDRSYKQMPSSDFLDLLRLKQNPEKFSEVIKYFQDMKEKVPTGAHIPLIFFLAVAQFDVQLVWVMPILLPIWWLWPFKK